MIVGHNLEGNRMDLIEPSQPGYSLPGLRALMRRTIARTGLNLSGKIVVTEAASGAYATTPVIAAMAGAGRVYALARPSRYGTVAEVTAWIYHLAIFAGVADRITVVEGLSPEILATADIVTNSGHVRPLTAEFINQLPSKAVIALMFEAWEFRSSDIDLDACARRGIPVVGVNERHPTVDVFSFLGPLCVKQLHDCGLAVYGNRLALLCDNDFAEPMFNGLSGIGAQTELFTSASVVLRADWDAIVVALRPEDKPRVGAAEARHLAQAAPSGVAVVQFWGDIDRPAVHAHSLNVWPRTAPAQGHMGVLLSDIGPEPIVRLQTGGLRAAEWVMRGGATSADGIAQLVQPI